MNHGDSNLRRQTVTHWGAYTAVLEGGRVARLEPIRGDRDPSPIGRSVPGAVDGPARIRRPAIRRGYLRNGPDADRAGRGAEPFVEVDWDVALDIVAREIERTRAEHGNSAIFGGSYGWASAGRFHHANGQLHRFLNLAGGYAYSVNTYSTGAAEVILPHVIGPYYSSLYVDATTWASIAEHTQLFVAFGGVPLKNSQVNAGGVSNHQVRHWLERCTARGTRFVNVGPIRDDLGSFVAPRWIAVHPNTDVALMLGLAHTICSRGLHAREFLERYCVGFERLLAYLDGTEDGCAKTAEWAAAITGIDAQVIRDLAIEMATSRTFICLSWSLQRADHGEQPYWMGVALAAILGGIGLPGTGIGFGYGAVANIGGAGRVFRGPTLPQGRNAVRDFIPVARIADMLLHPGEQFDYDGKKLRYPDIRLVHWAGGNPFHHHQDLNRLLLAWRRPETIVVHEQYWNAHARHADIVLPATTFLERNDIATATREPAILAMDRVIAPIGMARNDHDILADLAARLGFEREFTEGRDEQAWLTHMYEECREGCRAQGIEIPDFATFWSVGRVDLPPGDADRVLLRRFRENPDAHPLTTPSGRIEIHSAKIASFGYDDCPGRPAWLEPYEWRGAPIAERYPLHLLSNQPVTRLHAQYDHGAYSRDAKVQGREPLLIHPIDAARRNIASGDVIRVFNDRGACLAGAVITDAVRQGVVQLSTGAWYDPEQPGTPGSLEVHGNPNVLTRDKGTSKLAQGPSAHSTLVEVTLHVGALPAVKIHEPPPFERQ